MTRQFFGQRLSKEAIKRGKTVKPSPLCASICQMIQLNSFMKPGQMVEHLQGPSNTNEPTDDSDDKRDVRHQSNKRNADGKLKRGKDGIITKQTQFKEEPRELPTKWKNMLEAYKTKHGKNNLPRSFKITEILKADSTREASEKLGLGPKACLLWSCFGSCPHRKCHYKHENALAKNFNGDKMCIVLKTFEEGK